MPSDNPKRFPLPPRKNGDAKKRRPLHRRALRAAVAAPGKLLQRVNEELYKRNAELRARNKTLALLRKLDEISLGTLSLREMGEQMVTAIATELGYDLVTIAVADEQDAVLRWLTIASSVPWITAAIKTVDVENFTLILAADRAATIALQKRIVQATDRAEAAYPIELIQLLQESDQTPQVEEIRHTMLFPLRFADRVLGVLTISTSQPLQKASRYEQESVTGIVGLVSLAMYKAKIYQELQATSAQLAEANERLKDIDKAKTEFLSIASHQLYTPLTALRGYLSMLQEKDFGELPEKQAPIIKILEQSANRLITLIKSLLDISRIEAGRLELKLESIDLVEMAKQMVQDLMPNARARKLGLEFHAAAEDVPHAVADRERIRQVMLNFIDNAIKYTPAGKIDVQIASEGDTVIFSVRDTGKGLKPEEIGRLFTKFTRVGGSDRLHTEGTGLGLYVAEQIVKEHHGQVKAQSPGVGKGSTFSMILPAEGSAQSLKVGEQTSVEIKAAESQQKTDPKIAS